MSPYDLCLLKNLFRLFQLTLYRTNWIFFLVLEPIENYSESYQYRCMIRVCLKLCTQCSHLHWIELTELCFTASDRMKIFHNHINIIVWWVLKNESWFFQLILNRTILIIMFYCSWCDRIFHNHINVIVLFVLKICSKMCPDCSRSHWIELIEL